MKAKSPFMKLRFIVWGGLSLLIIAIVGCVGLTFGVDKCEVDIQNYSCTINISVYDKETGLVIPNVTLIVIVEKYYAEETVYGCSSKRRFIG